MNEIYLRWIYNWHAIYMYPNLIPWDVTYVVNIQEGDVTYGHPSNRINEVIVAFVASSPTNKTVIIMSL